MFTEPRGLPILFTIGNLSFDGKSGDTSRGLLARGGGDSRPGDDCGDCALCGVEGTHSGADDRDGVGLADGPESETGRSDGRGLSVRGGADSRLVDDCGDCALCGVEGTHSEADDRGVGFAIQSASEDCMMSCMKDCDKFLPFSPTTSQFGTKAEACADAAE